MTHYEQLLGLPVEDAGYHVATRAEAPAHAFNTLIEDTSRHQLSEVAVILGNVRADLRPCGTPYLMMQVSEYPYEMEMKISPWAMTQISEKMGMGAAGYIKRCLMNGLNELVPLNINKWLHKNKDKVVVFRYQENPYVLRAVVSERYGFFDHKDVLLSLSDVFSSTPQLKDFNVQSLFMSPDNLSLRVVDPQQLIVRGTSNQNDASTIGLHIRNGQTGQTSLVIEFMIYTFFCSNGVFIGADRSLVYRKKHFNITHEDFKREFTESITTFPSYIVAARSVLEQSRSIPLNRLAPSVEEEADFVKKFTKLTTDQIETVQTIRSTDWDNTLWGLSGAVTQFAQLTNNTATQYDLEQSAGRMLEQGLRLVA